MNINIYANYKIKKTIEDNRLSEDCESIYDNMFVKDEYENEEVIDGSKLLDSINYYLSDNYLQEFVIVGNELHFEIFNYNNGESQSICIKILGSVKK